MMSVVLMLAEDAPVDPTTGKGPEWGKAAPIALLIILLMGVALFLLIRSMNRQLKKVPSDFMRGTDATPAVADGSAAPAPAPDTEEQTSVDATSPPPGDAGSTTRS